MCNCGKIRATGSLQKTFIDSITDAAKRTHTADSQILFTHFLPESIPVCLHGDKRLRAENAEQQENGIDADRQKNSVSGNTSRLFRISLAQCLGKQGVDANTGAHANSHDQQLNGIGIRQGEHGSGSILHMADKNGVHNIVHRLQYHREHHGHSHAQDQGADWKIRQFVRGSGLCRRVIFLHDF